MDQDRPKAATASTLAALGMRQRRSDVLVQPLSKCLAMAVGVEMGSLSGLTPPQFGLSALSNADRLTPTSGHCNGPGLTFRQGGGY